jgi:3-hydroxybutyrate dehydrogenase
MTTRTSRAEVADMGTGALAGRVALVTGAASGIGLATARLLVERGARVLLHDVRPEPDEIARKLGGSFLRADLGQPSAVVALAEDALQIADGHIDILINNAGFQHVAPVDEFPDEIWINLIQVQLIAAFQLIKRVVPGMKESRWGRIINIGSIHAMVASPGKSAYISAKHGLIGLTKAVAVETASHGITANAVCPAYVRTPLVEKQINEQAKFHSIFAEEVIDRIMLEPAPIKRLIEPAEVAALIGFLCSEEASAITGSAQMIDLGWCAR